MTCMKVTAALAAFACTTYLGFLLAQQRRYPQSSGPAPRHGPPRPPRPQARRSGDDDLDAAAAERHHIHAEPHSPELIQFDDWSAKGRFTKPPARPYDTSYPSLTNLWDLVQRWNPDNVTMPVPFHETLAVLNYSDPHERALAEAYRNAEVPFKVYDVPDIESVRDAWTDVYLTDQFDRKGNQFKVEESQDNHFMYWRSPSASGRRAYPNWAPPTDIVHSTFADWLSFARGADDRQLGAESQHRYLMMGTPPLSALLRGSTVRRSHFVTKDLPCFTPQKENFFVTDVRKNKGVQCRFGMRGVIAEAHYDGGRNMVAMLRGAKRYILTPPTSCAHLNLIKDRKHPSFRHSELDWSHDPSAKQAFSAATAGAIDTIVREGEVLYIPSYWIHYIASLKYSTQCNTRSGSPPNRDGEADIGRCMGGGGAPTAATKKGKKKRRGAPGFHLAPGEVKDH